ncbi:MAG: hypothetical protein ACXVJJ_07725 [Halobacteriota archaeon]
MNYARWRRSSRDTRMVNRKKCEDCILHFARQEEVRSALPVISSLSFTIEYKSASVDLGNVSELAVLSTLKAAAAALLHKHKLVLDKSSGRRHSASEPYRIDRMIVQIVRSLR